MRHRLPFFLSACLLATAIAAAQPQNSSSGSAAETPSQPLAGTSPGNAAAASTGAPQPAKKVWTNEDVPALRGNDPISTVGSTSAKPGSKAAPAVKNNKAFQAQIARLEGQIPPLDAQIAELQAAIDGKPTGDGKTSQRPTGVKADDWGFEMQQLQKKRQSILDQIAALRDQARHQGVAPNTLP